MSFYTTRHAIIKIRHTKHAFNVFVLLYHLSMYPREYLKNRGFSLLKKYELLVLAYFRD